MRNIFKEVKTKIQFQRRVRVDYFAHIHEDIEVVFVKKGNATAFCEGKKYELCQNSFFLVAPYQVHRYIDSIQGEYILLVIKPSKLLRYGDVFAGGVPKTPVLQLDNDSDVAKVLEAALEEYIAEGYSGVLEGYLTAFFGKLLKYYNFDNGKAKNDTARQILQYCIEHYRESITVGDIARELNVSRSCVSHIFSSRFAINFCDYINSLRLLDAIELLKNESLSITSVALMSGFSNLRTFNRAFLKQYSTTPTAYRREILHKK